MVTILNILKYLLIAYNIFIMLGALQESIKNKTGSQNLVIFLMSTITIIYLIVKQQINMKVKGVKTNKSKKRKKK